MKLLNGGLENVGGAFIDIFQFWVNYAFKGSMPRSYISISTHAYGNIVSKLRVMMCRFGKERRLKLGRFPEVCFSFFGVGEGGVGE